MKKFILVFLLSFLFISSSFAYELTQKDKLSLDLINQKLEKIISQKGESYRNIFIEKLSNYSSKSNNEKIKTYVDYIVKNIGKGKTNEITKKDLGNGFFLSQTEDKTDLIYDGKVLYTWQHKVSDKNPFIYDEGCDELTDKLDEADDKIRKDNENFQGLSQEDKQKVWKGLGEKLQKECIRKNYNETVKIEQTKNSNFFEISKYGYEWRNIYLVDTLNKKLYSIDGGIEKIETGKNGIYLLYFADRGWKGGIILIKDDGKQVKLFENGPGVGTEDPEYLSILDFELLADQKIKVIYNGQNLKKMEKILDLKNFN